MSSTPHGHAGHHGVGRSPTYSSWANAKQRCFNEKNTFYAHYGGCGVTVCRAWCDFSNFLDDMGERPSQDMTLDRIDPTGGYTCGHCPECLEHGWPMNCRWADRLTQRANLRNRTIREPTHCDAGHEWTPQNTRVRRNGYRECRECTRARDKIKGIRRRSACKVCRGLKEDGSGRRVCDRCRAYIVGLAHGGMPYADIAADTGLTGRGVSEMVKAFG